MANVGPNYWYGGSVQWTAVTAWAALTVYAAGAVRRQTAPAVGDERVFVCVVPGTSLASEPAWSPSGITKGALTAEAAGPTWQECTGQPGVNGDITNSPTWLQNKNIVITAGLIIYTAGTASLQISSAGTTGNGSEPGFSATAGVTTADNSVTWTSLGLASAFGAFAAPFARMQSMVAATWFIAATQEIGLWADNHAETQSAATTITLPAGTPATTISMIAVDHTSGTPWTAAMNTASASISTTGANALTVTTGSGTGNYLFNGFILSAGSGAVNAGLTVSSNAAGTFKLFNGKLIKAGTTANANAIVISTTLTNFILNNTTCKVGNVSDSVNCVYPVRWENTTSWCDTSTATPTLPIKYAPGSLAGSFFEGIDFSAFGSGKTLFSFGGANSINTIMLIGCKLNASVTVCGNTAGPSSSLFLVNCDSGGSIARQEVHGYQAILTTETTIIRTGGASDGITPISWKITPNANNQWAVPFQCFPRVKWNLTTGSSVTATIYGIWGGGSVPNNTDIWIVVKYFGDASSPLYSSVTTGKTDLLASNSPTSTDTSAWGGSTTPFKMAATFTPQLAGYVEVIVYIANAATTIYIDPQIYLS